MGITLSVENLSVENALHCGYYEIRRAYVILSRDGVVTAQTLSEGQNDILKQSVGFFEVSTDVDCDELLATLHDGDVQSMLNDIYNEHVSEKNCVRSPEPEHEPSDAYIASQSLESVFRDIRSPEPKLPAIESDFDDIKF